MTQEAPYHNESSQQAQNSDVIQTFPTPEILASTSPLETAIIQATPEADHAPSWFKEAFGKIADAWYDPKSFESEQMYEKLGVRFFKKYVPTSGDLARRLVWKRFGIMQNLVKPGSLESLKEMNHFSKLLEEGHLALFGVMSAVVGADLAVGDIKAAVATTAINALVNVYPIMLQRYNRIRVYRAINRMEQRQQVPQEHYKDVPDLTK